MRKPSREESERIARLSGSGEGWGGNLLLPHLCSALLDELLDEGILKDSRALDLVRDRLEGKEEAVRASTPGGDGTVRGVLDDILAQLEHQRILVRNDGGWARGPELRTGELLTIVPPVRRNGVTYPPQRTTVWEKEERNARSQADHDAAEAAIMTNSLRPEGRGLRPVDRARASAIRDSAAHVGELYPVLVDQHGNILDGKHRLEANPNWKTKVIRIESDEQALAIALWANYGQPLPPSVENRIKQLVGTLQLGREATRERIRQELLADPQRPDREIGRVTGAGKNTVARIREAMESNGPLDHFERGVGRPRKDGTPAQSRQKYTPEETAALEQEIERRLRAGEPTLFRELAEAFGMGTSFVQKRIDVVKDRLAREAAPALADEPPWEAEPQVHEHRVAEVLRVCACGHVMERKEVDGYA